MSTAASLELVLAFFLQRQKTEDMGKRTPIRNSKVPTRKTTTMITVKASKPPIVNGCGVGGSGGGLGQELSQSAHEQAGVLSCIAVNNSRDRPILMACKKKPYYS
uniref:Uncharacterized protein n=1 Tax=Glossina austeni TaxID=7395 RepID=A0A1A9UD12_GLOAU